MQCLWSRNWGGKSWEGFLQEQRSSAASHGGPLSTDCSHWLYQVLNTNWDLRNPQAHSSASSQPLILRCQPHHTQVPSTALAALPLLPSTPWPTHSPTRPYIASSTPSASQHPHSGFHPRMLSISRGNCSITEARYGLSMMFGNSCWAPLLLWRLSSAVLCVWTPSYSPQLVGNFAKSLQILTTLFKHVVHRMLSCLLSHWLRTSRWPSQAC